jgi:hypothetical protein
VLAVRDEKAEYVYVAEIEALRRPQPDRLVPALAEQAA